MAIATRLGKQTLKGGEIVSRILAAEGVQKVFGIIDGTYFGMYSTFGPNGISLVTPRHETCALHMAGAYARVTGKLGVAIASNGPGVANALPGVAVEQAEGNRVLLITSCRREGIVYPDRGGAFQSFPQVAAISAMAKFSCLVPTIDRVAELLRRALRMCYSGRPGLVHLDIPESVMNANVAEDPTWFRRPGQYRLIHPLEPTDLQVDEVLRQLAQAKRPLIHVGSGVVHAQASQTLMDVADELGVPITTSWGARAAVDERSELTVPMIYVDAVDAARSQADWVLVLGSRLGETDWWGKAPRWASPNEQKLVQVDLDLEQLGNNRPVDLPIQADVGAFLRKMLQKARGTEVPATRKKWSDKLQKMRQKRRASLDKHLRKQQMPMHSAHVPTTCRDIFGDDAILVVDGGNTSIWGLFYHEVRAFGSVLATAKMGMLGAGVAQALGAKVAFPERPVYCIIGDGAMGFHPQEIETAVRHDLRVIYLVLCDRQWGMVKINQQFAMKPLKTLIRGTLSPEETINTDLGEIQFDQLARSIGAHGERVADPAGLRGAIERSIASNKPAVIHVDVDPVAHMWAPNLKTFKEMHEEPKG